MAIYIKGKKISATSGRPVEIIGIDTTDATAGESDILLGKTAYVNNIKITGISTFDSDTKDATATAKDIYVGQTAYINEQKVTGTMPDNGSATASIDGLTSTSVDIPAGYTSGGTVSLTSDIEDALAAI